jgi:hypothetical protein
MNEILGEDVLLMIFEGGEYVPYICAKEVAIEFIPELVNKTTLSSGRGYEYKVRRVDWKVTISGISSIVGTGHTVFDAVNIDKIFTGSQIKMEFTDEAGNEHVFTGTVLMENGVITGPQDEFSGFDLSFQGSGLWNATEDTSGTPPPEPVSDNVESDWWEMTEGSNIVSGASAIKSLSLVGVTVLDVARSGMSYDIVTTAPGNREVKHDSAAGTLEFETDAYPDETVFVLYKT